MQFLQVCEMGFGLVIEVAWDLRDLVVSQKCNFCKFAKRVVLVLFDRRKGIWLFEVGDATCQDLVLWRIGKYYGYLKWATPLESRVALGVVLMMMA